MKEKGKSAGKKQELPKDAVQRIHKGVSDFMGNGKKVAEMFKKLGPKDAIKLAGLALFGFASMGAFAQEMAPDAMAQQLHGTLTEIAGKPINLQVYGENYRGKQNINDPAVHRKFMNDSMKAYTEEIRNAIVDIGRQFSAEIGVRAEFTMDELGDLDLVSYGVVHGGMQSETRATRRTAAMQGHEGVMVSAEDNPGTRTGTFSITSYDSKKPAEQIFDKGVLSQYKDGEQLRVRRPQPTLEKE